MDIISRMKDDESEEESQESDEPDQSGVFN